MRFIIQRGLALALAGVALAGCQPKVAEAPEPAFKAARFDQVLETAAAGQADADVAKALRDFKTASPADKERVAKGETTVDFSRQPNVERTICRPTRCHVKVRCTQHWWRGDVNDCVVDPPVCDDIDPSDCHNGLN